ncbi:MAG: Wzz/FepE/Etk N-terminal domain-containing protein [Sphingomonadales bacterium]
MTTTDYEDAAAEPQGDGIGGLLANVWSIAKQRKWMLIIPAIVCAIAAVGIAFLIPATYRSKAVLLVESPQLASVPGGTQQESAIDERVAKVRQQVLSRPDLIAIAQELQLYPKRRASTSLGDIVEDMRKAITIEPVSTQIQQRSATIAFSLSFDYSDPYGSQAVAQKLVERMLEVDSTRTAERAADNVRFLTDQSNAIRTRMAELQGQVSMIKSRYGQVLSSQGMTMLGGSAGGLDAQIAALERENSQLRAQRETAKTSAPRDPIVLSAEQALSAARAVYAETHPDVVIARQRLAEAKLLAEKNVANIPFDSIASQIETNNGQISILRAARSREAAQVSSVLSAQSRAPVIQEQVGQLEEQLKGMNDQYQDTALKLAAANTALRVENEQKGERLTVVDPPVVDETPVWPNRWLISGAGAGVGVALGLMLAFGLELLFQPLRGPRAAMALAGGELLGAIPTLASQHEKRGRLSRLLFWKRRTAGAEE